MKTVIVTRLGAIGDHIQATVVFKYLKRDGYHITYNMTPMGANIIKNNPYIDDILLHPKDSIPNEKLGEHWAGFLNKYDKHVNLGGIVEGGLLKSRQDPAWNWSWSQRHDECNENYTDAYLKVAGYPEIKGVNPKLYIGEDEDYQCRHFMKRYRDDFVIMWALSGSSLHKTYPFMEFVVDKLKPYKDIKHITTGEDLCRLLEWNDKNTLNTCGKWSVRRSIIMTKYVDLVIGPETGVLNAASCFSTPKIIFLTHSSFDNLPKYWKNVVALNADHEVVPCQPCHKLTVLLEECNTTKILNAPACIVNIHPSRIVKAVLNFYNNRMRRAA